MPTTAIEKDQNQKRNTLRFGVRVCVCWSCVHSTVDEKVSPVNLILKIQFRNFVRFFFFFSRRCSCFDVALHRFLAELWIRWRQRPDWKFHVGQIYKIYTLWKWMGRLNRCITSQVPFSAIWMDTKPNDGGLKTKARTSKSKNVRKEFYLQKECVTKTTRTWEREREKKTKRKRR